MYCSHVFTYQCYSLLHFFTLFAKPFIKITRLYIHLNYFNIFDICTKFILNITKLSTKAQLGTSIFETTRGHTDCPRCEILEKLQFSGKTALTHKKYNKLL